jgi:SRSO17 transposase
MVDDIQNVITIRMLLRHVEDCFRRAKSECGLADGEVQSWTGWHHHVTLCLLAAFFLMKETLRGKKVRRR